MDLLEVCIGTLDVVASPGRKIGWIGRLPGCTARSHDSHATRREPTMTMSRGGAGAMQMQAAQTAPACERCREGDGRTATEVQSDNLTLRAFRRQEPREEAPIRSAKVEPHRLQGSARTVDVQAQAVPRRRFGWRCAHNLAQSSRAPRRRCRRLPVTQSCPSAGARPTYMPP
jgi:hypothetical protein